MRFTCEKSILNDAISTCIHAVASKNSVAVLDGLLFTVDDAVTINGYNFKTGITRTFDATIHEKGTAVLSARVLADIVRKLPDDIVDISVDERLTATIKCMASEFTLIAMSSKEYPDLPTVERGAGLSLPNSTLKSMISDTIFAVSDNENKPIHTGSLFECENGVLTVVSIDGYRLAIRREPVSGDGDFRFVVPGATLREISRILPDDDEMTTIYPERKHALFESGGTVVTTRLLEGEFLNYKAAVPDEQPIRLKVDRAALIEAIERVSLIISERLKNHIRCLFEDTLLKLSCVTALGRAYDECPIPECPEKIEIGFNNRFLLEALRACHDDEILFELKGSLAPCTMRPVEGDKYTFLVLPVRITAGQ